ncbi:S-adenosyl-L-methionine-dependent methyltransferase [Tricladium varicosporioides]|nr:S-adenosyl-L-methionine-dependent methyltransferase [Hymenoscyphus varicosporioides]
MTSHYEISSLVTNLSVAASTYLSSRVPNSSPTSTAKNDLIASINALLSALSNPDEEVWKFLLQPGAHACAISAWRCGILAPWPKESMTAKELSEMLRVNEKLVVRIMRALTLYDIFEEKVPEVYTHSRLSTLMTSGPLSHNALPLASHALHSLDKLPEYLAQTSYQNPGDDQSENAKSLFQFAQGTDLEFFEWMQKPAQEQSLKAFNESMASSVASERREGVGFADFWPFASLVGEESTNDEGEEEVLIVDVGGGLGHVLKDIQDHIPELKGRKMVLEDLPKTVANHLPLSNTSITPYNFLTTLQPIIGAKVYILRHVLHDWPFHICQRILRNTKAGMRKGSRVLVVEVILPEMNAGAFGSLMDIQMMKYGGSGRKEGMWREIFEGTGLRLVKIWPTERADSVFELTLVDE